MLRVWIRLPCLLLEYFNFGILAKIGDRIGKTVRVDHTTLEGSRGNFARLCMEVDLSKPLLSKYHLRRRVRRIDYEVLHTIYFSCGCYGHEEGSSPEPKEDQEPSLTATTFSNPMFNTDEFREDRPEVEDDFGPWMKVTRQSRHQSRGKHSSSVPVDVASPVEIV
ncbi:hypothetical protein LINPERHAP2_LOCUS23165 [Linum perenne]